MYFCADLESDSKFAYFYTTRMITRKIEQTLRDLIPYFKVITITGPRQSGKTTLCKQVFPDYAYVNLEDIAVREQAATDPKAFLSAYTQGVIIDEAQNYPELFSYIQVISDANPDRRYVITGSSNFSLLENISQSLAGRAAVLTLLPLSLQELDGLATTDVSTDTLLLKGCYPAVWAGIQPYHLLYPNYYTTYVERDVRRIVNVTNLRDFQTFIRLAAGRAGTEFNASALSNAVGVSVKTIQSWLSILTASYITFTLSPFYENIGKRLIKAPKLYFFDTGLLCYLLGIETEQQLATHPLRGNIFENYVVVEAYKQLVNQGKEPNLYFYRDSSQHEVDLLRQRSFQYEAYEIKSSQTFTRDFLSGLHYLGKLLGDRLIKSAVIYAGEEQTVSTLDGIVNYRHFKI